MSRWDEIQDAFHRARSLPAAERTPFLRSIGAADDLIQEVSSLLAADERGGLLARLNDHSEPFHGGGRVGPYRLIEPLGVGGMGIVYLAERVGDDFTQRVALKLIRAGFTDPRLEERLKRERRILARLEHPGIARFIDGGTTETGQSWFAMEYVEGTGLVDYVATHRLTVADRLRLFIEVCDAVHHAHQQLIVHGDLKPSNIMVASGGRPKLLDFGIAELLEGGDGPERTTVTTPWLTPAYASPEQIRRERVTTLTDVYALGVVLFELLAERRPYHVESLSPAEIEHMVCEVEPPRPSTVATQRRVRRLLAGDLDLIVLKALAKDPNRRYGSADALAQDLERYLQGLPVRARPDSLGYRASRFVRRHRTAVAAGVTLLLVLVAGVAATAWQASATARQRDRAEQALRQSEDVTAFLVSLFQASDPQVAGADTGTARAVLRRGLERVNELAEQPAVQARMLDALGSVLLNLAQLDRARELTERALTLRRRSLGPEHPDVAVSLRNSARVLRVQADYATAEARLLEALAIQQRALGRDHPEVAQTLHDLGFLMPYLGRLADTERYYRDALAIAQHSLGDGHPLVGASMIGLAATLRRRGDYDSAEVLYRRAWTARQRALGPEHPDVALAMVHLADQVALRPGGDAEAERLYREALAIQRRVLGSDHLALGHPMTNLAELLSRRGEHAEAEALYRAALALRERLLGPDHSEVAHTTGLLAGELAQQGRFGEAERLSRAALATWRRALGGDHPGVAGILGTLADILIAQDKLREAETIAREATALRVRGAGDNHPLVALALAKVADIRARLGAREEAERMLLQALRILSDAGIAPTHRDVRMTRRQLASLYHEWGRPADAARYETVNDSSRTGAVRVAR